MIRQGDTKKKLPKLVWSSTVKTLLFVASLIYRGTEVNAQNHYQCIKEGYHADPKDCHVYYRCVNWGTITSESQSSLTKFKFECGPGTVFSHIKGNICVHPNDSERPECRKSENDLDFNMNDYEDNQEVIYPHPLWPSSSQPPNNYPSYIPPEYPNEGYPSNAQQRPNNTPSYIPPMNTNQGHSSESLPKPSKIPSYIPPSVDSTTYKLSSVTEGLTESAELLPPPVTGIDNSDCLREGFMAHPKDCKKFIRCVSDGTGYYQMFEFTCGEGTLWDSKIEACNHEWAVEGNCFSQPTSTQSNDSGTTHLNQQSTNKKPTVPTEPTQNSGYLPPSTLRPVTSESSQAQQPIGSLSTINQESLTPYPSTPSSFDMTSITPTMTTQANYIPQGASDGDCIVEGFFSNPENCRKFYRCVAQEGRKLIKYEFECGEGTAWDTNIQACNHEHTVSKCNSSDNNGLTDVPLTGTTNNDEKKNKTSEKESKTTKEPETFTKEKSKPTDDITGSSSFGSTSTTISMSTITEEINFTTESSIPIQSSISIETLMPTETSTSSEAVISSSTTSKLDESLTISTSTTLSSTNTTPNKQPAISKCKDEGFYADPNDCHKFYRCVKTNGEYTKFNFDCAPGTAWDQSILTCNYAHLVSSCGSETNEIPSFTTEIEKPMDSTTKPKGNDSNTSLTPTTIFASTTTSSSSTQANKEAVTINKNDESSKNNDENIEPTTENSRKSSTTMNISNTSDSSTIESNTSGSTKPNLSNDTIKCDSAGFYPHPTQCDKFYRCVDNGIGYNVYYFDCAPGTIFDPSISVCNYPESIYPPRDCSGNPSSSSLSSTSVTSTISTSETEITTQISTTTSRDIDEGTTTEFTEETTEIEVTTDGLESTSTEKNTDTSTMSTEEMIESTTVEESGTTAIESNNKTSTEPSTETEAESSTENDKPITTSTTIEPDISSPIAPCILGNLTDEQIVFVCPTGFRRHPKYCNMFYQCTSEGNMEIKILVLVCPENTIFDEEKVQCLAESENSQPCNTELTPARFYRQIEKSSTRPIRATRDSLCPGEGHYPYQKGCSNVFYKCKRNQKNFLQGYLYRCPNDFVYWSVSRRCEKASRLRTCSQEQHDKDRDEIDTWNKRWKLPIEDSNLSARMIYF